MTNQMRAIEITAPGGPEVLKETQRPRPKAGQGEVVIRVAFAGVNRPDALQRAGNYAPPPDASDLPGLEAAGEVVEVGEGAEGIAVGMTTRILPHNFIELLQAEVAYMRDEAFEILPDFPTGGQILTFAIGKTEFPHTTTGFNTRLGKVARFALGNTRGTTSTDSHLNGAVAIAFKSFQLGNAVGLNLNYRYGHCLPVFRKNTGHTGLATDNSNCHVSPLKCTGLSPSMAL